MNFGTRAGRHTTFEYGMKSIISRPRDAVNEPSDQHAGLACSILKRENATDATIDEL
jgi:hypothetical protein